MSGSGVPEVAEEVEEADGKEDFGSVSFEGEGDGEAPRVWLKLSKRGSIGEKLFLASRARRS